MNQHDGNDNQPQSGWLTAEAASALIDVKRATLYAYVSQKKVRSRLSAPGSRRRVYHRGDLERLKARRHARSGHGAVAAAALRWGEPVLESAITAIRPEGPVYRERPALSFTDQPWGYETATEHLWATGPLDLARWHTRSLVLPADGLRGLLAGVDGRLGPRPLDAVTLLVTASALHDSRRFSTAEHVAHATGRDLIRHMAAAPALLHFDSRLDDALAQLSVAAALAVALDCDSRAESLEAIDCALVLAADHELNASTFSARVAASVGAELHACLTAALAATSGARHGGMSERTKALIDETGGPENAISVVRGRLRRGDSMPGFGHPLYPGGDPRAWPLIQRARRLAPNNRAVATAIALIEAVELAGGQPPTIDMGLVCLSDALGMPPGSAVTLFAVGRTAGWVAHIVEQRQSGFILRPRAR